MRAEMVAASRHEHLVLYDPDAIPADTPVDPDLEAQDPALLAPSAMQGLTARGEALVVHLPGEDCEARIQLLLDESPTEAVLEHGTPILAGAALKVPSGTLKADGLEFLSRPGEVREHSQAESTTVPPGEYEIEVRELLTWKLRNRQTIVSARTRRSERVVDRLVTIYTWLGILAFPANLLVAPGLVSWVWHRRGWPSAAVAVGAILAADAILLAGFWLLQAARRRFPILSRAADAAAEFEREHPDIAVILRPKRAGFAAAPTLARIRV
jgi:hypothetical protein